jgi:hypothetical protein
VGGRCWSTSGPCGVRLRRELAELAELRKTPTAHSKYWLNLGDSAERITAFLANYPAPNLPILLDAEKTPRRLARRSPSVAYGHRSGILRLGAIGERLALT